MPPVAASVACACTASATARSATTPRAVRFVYATDPKWYWAIAARSTSSSWSSTSPIMNSWPIRCSSLMDVSVRSTQLSTGVGTGVCGTGLGVAGTGVGLGVDDGVGLGVGVHVEVATGEIEADGDGLGEAGALAGLEESAQPPTSCAKRGTATIGLA